jgi:phosphoglucomutase/phosphomannomutase
MLAFGTGGIRGVMGPGPDHLNIDTIRLATQGLANHLLKTHAHTPLRVFIGYDVRHHSRLFAEETARVLAGNGIEALITKEICPTPLASFGCRFYGCQGAVIITASHNPPEYNGYKVYGADGGQIVPPEDSAIVEEIRSLPKVHIASLDHPLVRWIGEEIDDAYLELQSQQQLSPSPSKTLRIIYTNLHGTGLRLVPQALARWNFCDVLLVEEQTALDGAFPRAPTPNPEEAEALALGSQKLLEEEADILLATDPDADRVGLVVRRGNQAIRMNGHEIACLLFSYLLERRPFSSHAAMVKSIVTTELLVKMAKKSGLHSFNTLTGFKYIAAMIQKWETDHAFEFLFGAEESHGYLYGTFVRDKDGISAACLLAEIAELAKQNGRTLIDLLYDLYRVHGVHRQSLTTVPIREGEEWKKESVQELKEDSKLIIRPSGTEPKIKIYAETWENPTEDIEASIRRCDAKLSEMVSRSTRSF